jgi:hypothetical protein
MKEGNDRGDLTGGSHINAIAIEIDQRESRLTQTKAVLLTIGGLSSLANIIYTGVVSEPDKLVTIPLFTISGSALLTLLPGISDDQRLDLLKQKMAQMLQAQARAEASLQNVDDALLDEALIEMDQGKAAKELAAASAAVEAAKADPKALEAAKATHTEAAAKVAKFDQDFVDSVRKINQLKGAMNRALLEWQVAAQ